MTATSALLAFLVILVGIAALSIEFLGDGTSQGPPLSVVGLLALFYPVYAIVSASGPGAAFADALGAGLSALGDVLGFAALFLGHFRMLGLNSRRFTGLVGFAVWIVGFSLGSAPFTAALAHHG